MFRKLAGVALLGAILAAAGIAYLRADKTEVFYRVRGVAAEVRILERERGPESSVRLVGLGNETADELSSAYVRRPHELTDDYRILLSYAGLKTGRRILELVPERDDVVLVAMQYPYEKPTTTLGKLGLPRRVRTAAYRTVAAGMLAVSFLEDDGLDLSRLTVLGVSLGSPFGVIHTALDERVPRVVVVHGGGDVPAIASFSYQQSGRPVSGFFMTQLSRIFLHTFEPNEYVGRIAPRELIVIAARGDHYFPASSPQTLFDRAAHPKTLLWRDTDHVRSRRQDLVDQIVEEIEALLDERL